ncbi:MAG: NifB/NifX family molybdenum-iron cluster-binding protein [Pseudomonadota bacterium]
MKIAIASQNRKTVTGHAGKCRRFWIYEVVDGQPAGRSMLELSIEQTFHESHGAGAHPLAGVDTLICGGMGSGLQRRLAGMGIRGLVTSETDPDTAVRALLDGALPLLAPEDHDHHSHAH